MNALKGFNVTEFQILLSQQPDGSNMNGTVYIPNPTVMTLEMVRQFPPPPLPPEPKKNSSQPS